MNICVITGSRKGNNSNTFRAIRDIIGEMKDDFNVDYINLWEKCITPCRECCSCFDTGICPLDKSKGDEMASIKEKILQADYLIIGTGVFLHNINSALSVFLERIALWTHLIKLLGKKCTIVVSTASNGHMNVAGYLNKIAGFLGLEVIEIVVFSQMEFVNPEYYQYLVKESARKIREGVLNKYEVKFTDKQEEYFKNIKLLYEHNAFSPYEREYWARQKVLDYASLNEYFESFIVNNLKKKGDYYEQETCIKI